MQNPFHAVARLQLTAEACFGDSVKRSTSFSSFSTDLGGCSVAIPMIILAENDIRRVLFLTQRPFSSIFFRLALSILFFFRTFRL
jgi:hypothetical protein